MSRVTRRAVLAGVVTALAPGPLRAEVATRNGMRRLGVLSGGLAGDAESRARATALLAGLDALGWKEGGNLRIEWRWAGGDPALITRYAAELVALAPDLLLAVATPCVEELRRRTSTIPIVFAIITDPVGQGFVENLAHPGGNITGFTDFDAPMAGKWLEMLTQIAPPAEHVTVLYNPATAPFYTLMMRAIEEAARSLAVTTQAMPIREVSEIGAVAARLAREERGALLVLPDSFTLVNRASILASAARSHRPAVYWNRTFVAEGGLMSYGTDQTEIYRRSAAYIDRILNGVRPGDLPVQNPTKFALTINLTTAKTLGVTVAPSLLATADEVIE